MLKREKNVEIFKFAFYRKLCRYFHGNNNGGIPLTPSRWPTRINLKKTRTWGRVFCYLPNLIPSGDGEKEGAIHHVCIIGWRRRFHHHENRLFYVTGTKRCFFGGLHFFKKSLSVRRGGEIFIGYIIAKKYLDRF